MMKDHIIDTVINQVLDHEVRPGDHAGGSGHLSFVSYSVKDVIKKQVKDNALEITCLYEKHILTEFTYEPDNPPYRYSCEKRIMLYFGGNTDPVKITDEETLKNRVNHFIEYYLLRIEHGYGDCRAPVRFPPYYYSEIPNDTGIRFYCFIDSDLGDNETLAFVSSDSDPMLEMIKNVFKERFDFNFQSESHIL